MKTAKSAINPLLISLALGCFLIGVACAMQVDCLQRDWFTLLAKNNFDVTSIQIATSDSFSGLQRLAIALTDQGGKDGETRSSQLAYLNYVDCDILFFVKNKRTFQANLFSIAIQTDDINSVKTFETLYEVGKVQDEDTFQAIVIEDGTVNTFTFDSSAIDFTGLDVEERAKCQLKVLDTRVLLWTHPLGAFLVDLNIRVARSVHFAPENGLVSLVSLTESNRYIHTISWQKQSLTDQIWLKTYDFNRLSKVQTMPYQTQDKTFNLFDTVDGVIVAGSSSTSAALCFTDSTQRLNLAMWTASADSSLYITSMNGNSKMLFTGCASVAVEDDWDGSHSVKAIVYTSDHRLAYVYQGIPSSTMSSLTSASLATLSISYTKTTQRFTMFDDLTSLQFSITDEFIAINTLKLFEQEKWGFILNTDQTGLRRTILNQNSRQYETTTLALVDAESQVADEVYSFEKIVGEETSTTLVSSIAWPFAYNSWVPKLCPQPDDKILLGKSYDLDYPKEQDLSIYLGPLIETDLDEESFWYYTCFPIVELDIQPGLADNFVLQDFDKEATAIVKVEKVASADIFGQRAPLLGLGPLYFERVKYQLGLDPSLLASEFNLTAYENQAPRITNPAPTNNQIFISIKWSPQLLAADSNSVFQPNPPLLKDIYGVNWDVLYESGPVVDVENDVPRLVMEDLSPIFKFELTREITVRIKMAKEMQVEYSGMHKYRFELADDSGVKGPSNTYDVVIVIGLYDTAEAAEEANDEASDVKEVFDSEEFEKYSLVPEKYPINEKKDWFKRRSFEDRLAQLRVHPISSQGEIRVSFTKPVEMPEETIDRIMAENLVNVTFVPSSYDSDDDGGRTGLKNWSITRLSEHGFTVKVVFEDPDLIGYSIYEHDQLRIAVNLTSLDLAKKTYSMLYGRYTKSIPLQYPKNLGLTDMFNIELAIEIVPYAMILIFVISAALLVLSGTTDKTALVWLILSNLQLITFLPLVHVPIPAQVNDLSKGLAQYFRVDFIQLSEGLSLTETISFYIFDFQATEFEVPLHLEQLGFSSENSFMTASGVNLLHCCFVFPVALVSILLWLCSFRYPSLLVPFTKIRSVFYNNFYVRYNMETLLIYVTCYLISLQEASHYNWATSLQTTVGGVHTLLLFALPLTVIFFYNWNYDNLVTNQVFRSKWGSLYLGLVDKNEENKRKLIFQYPALLLSRKFVFAFCVVTLEEYWLVQVIFLLVSSATIITVVYQCKPYTSRTLNNLQIMHEVTIVILCDLLITFNGGGWLRSDQNMRFMIGWAYVGVMALSLAISFFVLSVVSLNALHHTLMQRKPKKKRDDSKIQRRLFRIQTKRRASVKAETGKVLANMLSTQNADLKDGPVTDLSLNSPTGGIVMQTIEAAVMKYKQDAERIKRGLTEIQEGESEEEDSSSSFTSSASPVSSYHQSCDSRYNQTVPAESSGFVMGLDLIPKISRQTQINKKDFGSRRVLTENNSIVPGVTNSNGFMQGKSNLAKNNILLLQTQSQPIQERNLLALADQKQRDRKISESSEDGPLTSSVSTRRHYNRGYQTAKSGAHNGANSFTNQMMLNSQGMFAQRQSVTPKKGHGTGSHSKRSRESRRLLSGQVSARSRSHQFYGAASRRSNVMDSLDEDVNQRLEALAEMKVSRRESKSQDLTGGVVRRPYVMGQQMAKKSLIHDMSESIMLLSKVHETRKSQEFNGHGWKSSSNIRLARDKRVALPKTHSDNFQIVFDEQGRALELNHKTMKKRITTGLGGFGMSTNSVPSLDEMIPPLHQDQQTQNLTLLQDSSHLDRHRSSSRESRKSTHSRSKRPRVAPLHNHDEDDEFFRHKHVSLTKPVEDTYIDLNRNIPLRKSNPATMTQAQESPNKKSQIHVDVSYGAKKSSFKGAPPVNPMDAQAQRKFEKKETRGRSPRNDQSSFERKRSRNGSKKSRTDSQTFEKQVSRRKTQGKLSPKGNTAGASMLEQSEVVDPYERKVSHHYEEYAKKNSWVRHVNSKQIEIDNTSSLADLTDESMCGEKNKADQKAPKILTVSKVGSGEKPDPQCTILSQNSCRSLRQLVKRENLKYELDLERQQAKINSARRAKTTKTYKQQELDDGHQKLMLRSEENPNFSSARKPNETGGLMKELAVQNLIKTKTPGFGDLSSPGTSIAKRESVQSKSRPTDMPYLDLSSQNLLAGIHSKVARKMSKKYARKESIVSEVSQFSAFSLDEKDNQDGSSPSNARFTSMQ